MPASQELEDRRPLTPKIRMDHILPSSPGVAASVGVLNGGFNGVAADPGIVNGYIKDSTLETLALPDMGAVAGEAMQLQLQDGITYQGVSFGAKRSIAGELVFQTGMVGYPESITDPSYRGQILVVTFPLVGNYGVPSRDTMDGILGHLPAHFEAAQIHVSGLVVASYAGEDYSHYLATSSLGTWLKEQNVPAMHGVDTRALTKRIREKGSMLGKMVVEAKKDNAMVNGYTGHESRTSQALYEEIEWFDPNTKNLVADGESIPPANPIPRRPLTAASLDPRASPLFSTCGLGFIPSFWPSCQSFVR